ncbi:MAG: AarF/UbiB family protein [Ilumatobacteraceae bacterium]
MAVLAAAAPVVLFRVIVAIALAIVTTLLSLRLLGSRRGWGTALLAGLIGWGTALVISVGLNGWDWDVEGLLVHLLVIGIPATMAAAVTIDLLARPGSLALGERAGLVITPRPVRAVRQRMSVLRRYRELVRLCRQEGFGPFLSAAERAERTVEAPGVRLRRVLEQAGGVYVKLGQIAATRVDLLPLDVCDELAELQNRVSAESKERMALVLEAELGAPVEEVFAEFDWEPLAAASIGQTYKARLHSGEAVVVKVQRPDIDALMERDLAALALLANLAQRRTPFGQGVRSGEMLGQFADGLRAELDFRREAGAMSEMAAVLSERSTVRVPKVYRDVSGRRVLVQERFEGVTLTELRRTDDATYDRAALADQLLRATLDQILRIGFFHADPHPGNVFALPDGSLGLIDFGAVGRLDPIQQSAIIDMMVALAHRDVSLLRDGVERVAELSDTTSPEQLERALARLMAEHVRPGGTVDPAVMEDLVNTLSRFGMRLPTDIVVLSRALVTVDGTLRGLVPELSLVDAATRLVGAGAEQPVVDPAQVARDELLAMVPHLRRLPERIDRILTLTGRGELRVRNVVDEDSRRIVRTLANRFFLLVAGATFLFTSVWLLVSSDPGPEVSGQTGLFDIFGYGGLLIGVVLVLRVVASVARDGTT